MIRRAIELSVYCDRQQNGLEDAWAKGFAKVYNERGTSLCRDILFCLDFGNMCLHSH